MDFRILGPLEVTSCGERLPLGGPNQRALLALLILHANESVRRERLIDEIWGESPPRTAHVSLNGYVSKLRKLLTNGSGAAVETHPDGYALRVEPERLDVNRFEHLVAKARESKAGGRPRDAEAKLAAALELWRGPPLADFAYAPFAQSEISRLEELRLAAVEERYELELDQGRHAALVGELEKLASDHPLRERPAALLILALYRSGRQAEALQAYDRARRHLAEELGLEPSETLRELQGRVLQRDPGLTRTEQRRDGAPRSPRAFRRGRLLVALLAAAGVVALVATLGFGRGGHGVRVAANSLGILDPATGRFVADVPLGEGPTLVTFGDGAAWVVNDRGRILSRIDARTRRVVDDISAPGRVTGLATGGGSIWLASSGDGRLRRIDPAYNSLGARSIRLCDGCGAALAAGAGALWTIDNFDTLARIDPHTARSTPAPAEIVQGAHGVAAGAGGVWVAGDGVTRVDPATLLPAGVAIPTGQAGAIAVGAGAVWVAVGNKVVEINPDGNAVEASVDVGSNPVSIAIGGHSVWVANSSDGTISRIDPAKPTVVDTIEVGRSPVGLAFGDGKLWVSAQ